MKQFWVKKVMGMIVCAALAIVAIGYVVMFLWNNILVAVLGVKIITYCQALGLFVLGKLQAANWLASRAVACCRGQVGRTMCLRFMMGTKSVHGCWYVLPNIRG